MLVKELGALYGRGGTTPAGAAVVRQLLGADGIPLGGVRIVDGSGLSLLDRLTANALVGLLESAWSSPTLHRPFVTALPVAGRSGTLDGRLTGRATRGQVVAKTGTTLRASSLAGYVKGRYAFAILSTGSPVNAWTARTAQDRFVTVLAGAG
jgi:D-alanyl-D-alanine carboxypeptidase/D-alanyl-D-alanine-endopeptidase (penicillin-binding protein 4)